MSYAAFAEFYDALMEVDYAAYADYLDALLQKHQHESGITLDLACGTGSLTLELAKRGYDVYGIDGSADMLSIAQQKAAAQGQQLLFLCQKMQRLDLFGTVHTVFCVLDSINHMTNPKDVQKTFDRVSLFLEPGGCFCFDVNTVYKHREVLGNHTFVYDNEAVYCVWQNQFLPERDEVEITLDFFAAQGQLYDRQTEQFCERAYPQAVLEEMLQKAGLEVAAVYAAMTFDPPQEDTERLLFVARKPY